MIQRTIKPEVLEVLQQGKLENNVFFLPPIQLDKKLYAEVNKVLKDSGGEWDGKVKGHIFQQDPSEMLGLAVNEGVSVNQKNLYQEFFTPEEVCKEMAVEAELLGKTVLEPSAGSGRIADVCLLYGASKVTCVELRDFHCKTLQDKGFETINADFLECSPEKLGLFDRIMMNPPFNKGLDLKHVKHALKFLKPDGILVAIMSKEPKRLDGYRFVSEILPNGTFKESGTPVETFRLVVRKDDGKSISGHEYLVQKQDHPASHVYEVLDLTDGGRVFAHDDYDVCNAWIEGKV